MTSVFFFLLLKKWGCFGGGWLAVGEDRFRSHSGLTMGGTGSGGRRSRELEEDWKEAERV